MNLLLPLLLAASPDLSAVDSFLAPDRFETAFRLGEKTVIETKSCLNAFCDKPYDSDFVISKLTGTDAVSEGRGADGRPFSDSTITRADWEALSQNRVRFELRSMESAGYKAQLKSIRPSSRTIEINGAATAVATLAVEIEAVNGAGMKLGETLEVAPNLGGVGQLVLRHLDHGALGNDTFTVVKVSR